MPVLSSLQPELEAGWIFFTLSQIIREGVPGFFYFIQWDKAKLWGYIEVLSDKFPEALGPLTLLPCALSYVMVWL